MALERIRRLSKLAATITADVCALSGAASVVYGVSLLSVPAAWILGGLMLLGTGVLFALGSRERG